MRRILAWAVVATTAAACPGTARADDSEALRRLEAIAAGLQRVEAAAQALVARLDRIDARLSEIDVRLERLERAQTAPRAAPPEEVADPAAPGSAAPPPAAPATVTVTSVVLSNKRIDVRADTGDEYLRLDVEGILKGLLKAARIKARLSLIDRFGTVKKTYELTTEVIRPGERLVLKGIENAPFWRLSRSAEEDLWLRAVDIRELKGRVEVVEVVYGVDLQSGPVR